jgi:hypothetical protein
MKNKLFLKKSISGIIIENKGLFQVFKFMFDFLWKELEGKKTRAVKPI